MTDGRIPPDAVGIGEAFTAARQRAPWALDAAIEITEQFVDGFPIYKLPAGRKFRLTLEIADALEKHAKEAAA